MHILVYRVIYANLCFCFQITPSTTFLTDSVFRHKVEYIYMYDILSIPSKLPPAHLETIKKHVVR